MGKLPLTQRTKITRLADRGSYDKSVILEILKEGFICHISFVHDGKPFMLPNLYGVSGETIYIHGSVGSFLQRSLMNEIDLCFSVTLVDGLVLARSAFNHSVNYRSVIIFGKAKLIEKESEKNAALEVLTNHIIPGRWNEVRVPSKSELKKTMVLSFTIEEGSAKIRTGPPHDDEEDMNLNVWAGVLPLTLESGKPQRDPLQKIEVPLPESVINYNRNI